MPCPFEFILTQKTLLATLIRISTDRANFSVNKGMITWANRICPDKPFNLLSHHCFGHQFALICEHSAADVPYLSRFQAALLYGWIFVHYSAVRGFGLSELLKELKLQDVKLIKAAFTRWLSHGRAVLAQRACLAPLIRVMVNQAKRLSGDKKSELQGWVTQYRKFRYFATVYFFCDVLPAMNIFSRQLQARGLTFSRVWSAYNATRVRLQGVLDVQVNIHLRCLTDLGYTEKDVDLAATRYSSFCIVRSGFTLGVF
jgi:hypothetical protein